MRCPEGTSEQARVHFLQRRMQRIDREKASGALPASSLDDDIRSHRVSSRRCTTWVVTGLMLFSALSLVGCDRTESVQWGERGTSMIHIDNPVD
jgi:hypothetical protein